MKSWLLKLELSEVAVNMNCITIITMILIFRTLLITIAIYCSHYHVLLLVLGILRNCGLH